MTDPRTRLEHVAASLAEALKDVDGGGGVILPKSDAEYLATALAAFLSGDAASLDHAFALKRSRSEGRPKPSPTPVKVAIARDVLFRYGSQSLKDLSEKHDLDPRDMTRIAERNKEAAIEDMAAEIDRRLQKGDTK